MTSARNQTPTCNSKLFLHNLLKWSENINHDTKIGYSFKPRLMGEGAYHISLNKCIKAWTRVKNLIIAANPKAYHEISKSNWAYHGPFWTVSVVVFLLISWTFPFPPLMAVRSCDCVVKS